MLSIEVVYEARPFSGATVTSTVSPSLIVTDPADGAAPSGRRKPTGPVPTGIVDTTTLNVTGWPTTDGFGELLSAVTVGVAAVGTVVGTPGVVGGDVDGTDVVVGTVVVGTVVGGTVVAGTVDGTVVGSVVAGSVVVVAAAGSVVVAATVVEVVDVEVVVDVEIVVDVVDVVVDVEVEVVDVVVDVVDVVVVAAVVGRHATVHHTDRGEMLVVHETACAPPAATSWTVTASPDRTTVASDTSAPSWSRTVVAGSATNASTLTISPATNSTGSRLRNEY
jgi:hypothetical protein